jgi:hypothetical protein
MSDNATFYISDPSLIGSKLFSSLTELKQCSEISEGENATGLLLRIEKAELRMRFMPPDKVEEHLRSLEQFARQNISKADLLTLVLSRLRYRRFVIGCVIEPEYDDDGTVQEFVFKFNALLNGLLFTFDTLFDYDGEALAGRFAAP